MGAVDLSGRHVPVFVTFLVAMSFETTMAAISNLAQRGGLRAANETMMAAISNLTQRGGLRAANETK